MFVAPVAYCQPMQFENMTSNEGLPQNRISALMQDSLGFIWMGTSSGLCRFDGVDFKTFRRVYGSSSHGELLNSSVGCLAQDKKGNIWAGNLSQGGLNFYHYEKNSWIGFPPDSTGKSGPVSWMVNAIAVTKNGEVWFSSSNNLQQVKYSGDDFVFNTHTLLNNHNLKGQMFIHKIIEGDEHTLWLATTYGLVKYDRQKQKIIYDPDQLTTEHPQNILSLCADKNDNVWIGFEDGGIAVLPKNKLAPNAHIDLIPNWPESMSKSAVYDIIESAAGDIHFATETGLVTYNKKYSDSAFVVTKHIEGNDRSLINNMVLSMLADKSGNLWVGTERGLSKWFKQGQHFYTINNKTLSNFQNETYRIAIDNKGLLWTGGPYGIHVSDLVKKVVRKYEIAGTSVSSAVSGMAKDDTGNIWCVLAPWLICINNDRKSYRKIPIKYSNYLSSKIITNIAISPNNGDIWLGGTSELLRYDPNEDKWGSITFTYKTFITGLTFTESGRLFISNSFFLFEVDRNNMTLINIEKDGNGPDNKTSYLNLAKDIYYLNNKIYIAQMSGLLAYDISNKTWQEWHIQDGLPNEAVRALASDNKKNLWMSTSRGIACLQTNGKIKSYSSSRDFPALDFHSRAVARDNSGNIYFGSDKGVTYFNPSRFVTNTYSTPPLFTGFKLFNKKVAVCMSDSTTSPSFCLDKSIIFKEKLNLSYKHKVFTINFTALNHLEPEKNQYAYRLIGFNNEWIYTGNRNDVTFTNLEPGSYELQVKAANNDGIWCDKISTLKINVSPPWYKTYWAYTLYVLIFVLAIWFLLRYRLGQVRRKAAIDSAELRARTAEAEKKALELTSVAELERARIQEREAMRKKSAQDFHDEAGIKLTRIGLLTNTARQKSTNEDVQHLLNKIKENAQDLSSSMRDFIWVLDPEQDSLYDILQRLQDFGSKLFEYSNIAFKSDSIPEAYREHTLGFEEKRHIMLIFKEAMNNSLKYSEAETITLSVKKNEKEVHITMQDDGKGFDISSRQDSYGLRNMKSRAEKMNAGFKLHTVPGGGVKIVVVLKKQTNE